MFAAAETLVTSGRATDGLKVLEEAVGRTELQWLAGRIALQCPELFWLLEDAQAQAKMFHTAAVSFFTVGDVDRAVDLASESVRLWRDVGSGLQLGCSLDTLAAAYIAKYQLHIDRGDVSHVGGILHKLQCQALAASREAVSFLETDDFSHERSHLATALDTMAQAERLLDSRGSAAQS